MYGSVWNARDTRACSDEPWAVGRKRLSVVTGSVLTVPPIPTTKYLLPSKLVRSRTPEIGSAVPETWHSSAYRANSCQIQSRVLIIQSKWRGESRPGDIHCLIPRCTN